LFLLFFPLVTGVYFLLPHKFRWFFLLIASYYFYMNWKPVYAILIFLSTLITWVCGILMDKSSDKKHKKGYLVLSLLINFGILFIYKYLNFLNEVGSDLLNLLGIRWEVPNFDLLLPVGISFYTFQAVGYTIDVYRGDLKAENHFGIYALFVSFFPQLVAGPIERAKHLLPQFRETKYFSITNLVEGLRLALWGYFLKLVLADNLAQYVNAVFNNVEFHSGSSFALASVLFGFQIYGDFAGYSLIAIGVAKIMGFDLMTNFKRPYFAQNIASFWSRWHISLSTWFKDYLYIPLGGNRVSGLRTYFNLFFTFFVSGIWHGANYTYVVWGALHGMYLVIEKLLGIKKGKAGNGKENLGSYFLKIVATFLLVCFAWIFFRANSIGDAWHIIASILHFQQGTLFVKYEVLFVSFIALATVLLKECYEEFYITTKIMILENSYVQVVLYAVIFSMILLLGVFNSGQFIYFQF